MSRLKMIGRRRRFLVDSQYQLTTSFKIVGFSAALLLVINVGFFFLLRQRSALALHDSPELTSMFVSQDLADLRLMILASVVVLAGVFLVSILETHRTAGASIQLMRKLQELEEGHLGVQVRLRRDDHLRNLEAAFNRASSALLERARAQSEILEELARQVDGVGTQDTLNPVGQELHRLADASRNPAGTGAPDQA